MLEAYQPLPPGRCLPHRPGHGTHPAAETASRHGHDAVPSGSMPGPRSSIFRFVARLVPTLSLLTVLASPLEPAAEAEERKEKK